jgi:thiosulfate/3-mercaptopyruvate sulfurtransferase
VTKLKSIVDKEWLRSRLGSSNLVLLDCRFSLANSLAGKEAYQLSHLPDAVYCHLEENLSGPILKHGGRHPLPDLQSFSVFLENAGISNASAVVAYDNGEGAFAARLWWMMKYIGHEEVYVLNGGFKNWEEAGYPIDTIVPEPSKATYEIRLQPERLATYEEVKRIVDGAAQTTILIDSREPKRYLGLEEPIDKVAGRIPGAINKCWNEGLDSGQFKPLSRQLERFSDVSKSDSIIVYCGSGVTATPNYLVLEELGFKNLKLYVGSYSDWVSYDDTQIERINN